MSTNNWVKDTSGFIVHPAGGLETPFHEQDDYYTSNDRFFVCSLKTPGIDLSNYRLVIEGNGVDKRPRAYV